MGDGRTRGAVLVTGFGAFLDVVDNPSGWLAERVHGAQIPGGPEVYGLRLPVSYGRAPSQTLAAIGALRPRLVIGLGVATGRTEVCVEALGRRSPLSDQPDVDGVVLSDLEEGGPASVQATAPVELLARALGAVVSEDAGGYVCNAWLYRVLRGLQRTPAAPLPAVVFVHMPTRGLPPELLLSGISSTWSALSTAESQTPIST